MTLHSCECVSDRIDVCRERGYCVCELGHRFWSSHPEASRAAPPSLPRPEPPVDTSPDAIFFGRSNMELDPQRDWPEDFSHENGGYVNRCIHCEKTFIGHKRRVTCKLCVGSPRGEAETPTDQQRLSNVVYVLLGTRDPEKVRDWINLAYKQDQGLRAELERMREERDRLREDKELLDWCDTLPSGICVLGDSSHPQSLCMTPKAHGFSHTRQLILDAMKSRGVALERDELLKKEQK